MPSVLFYRLLPDGFHAGTQFLGQLDLLARLFEFLAPDLLSFVDKLCAVFLRLGIQLLELCVPHSPLPQTPEKMPQAP